MVEHTAAHPSNTGPLPLKHTPTNDEAPQSPPAPRTLHARPGEGVDSEPVLRRSSRVTKGLTTKYEDYATGSQFDRVTNDDSVCSVSSIPWVSGPMFAPALQALPLPPGYENVSYFWNLNNSWFSYPLHFW